jgi:lysophospholipase L1-like esterase
MARQQEGRGPPDESMETRPTSRLVLLPLAVVLTLLLIEGVSWGLLVVAHRGFDLQIRRTATILAEHGERARISLDATNTRETLDPIVGWTNRPGFADDADRVNAAGLRSSMEFDRAIPDGLRRVAAFGDSFIYGTEVGLADAWSSRVGALCPDVEVLNFGVPAYGTDQAYLRFLGEARRWDLDVVLIGFAPVSVQRGVNVYRPFIHDREWPRVKPRFRLASDGSLETVPNPLVTPEEFRGLVDDTRSTVLGLGEDDFWFRPWIWRNPLYDLSATVRLASFLGGRLYMDRLRPDRLMRGEFFNTESEAFRVQVALLESFHDAVVTAGGRPAVLVLPDQYGLERVSQDQAPHYAPVLDALEDRGIPIVDLTAGFLEAAPDGDWDAYFAPGGHYSRAGNQVFAREICRWFDSGSDEAWLGEAS